jgi:ribosomal protein S18 acetylase RimI-like enzyme
MDVRRLRPTEWEAFRALRLRALADAPDAFGSTLAEERDDTDERWQRRAHPSDGFVAVAEREGVLVGLAIGAPAPGHVQAAGLFSMWVDPAERGHGLGGRLIDAVVDWARGAGYGAIGLGVTTTNHGAIALYERLGFVDSGERHPLRERTDLVIQIMVRTLD